jgi:hypothetical protein
VRQRKIFTLSHYVLLEAWNTHLFWLILGVLGVGYGLAFFVGQIALTETHAMQTSLLAAFLRLAAVYVLCLFIISSMAREQQQQLWLLWLSLPMSRATYVIGRGLGYAGLALGLTVVFSALLAFYAPWPQLVIWSVSLGCELLIMAGLSLLCVLTLAHILPAFSLVAAFYLLARSISAIQLMTEGVLFQIDPSFADQMIVHFINILALLLPDLSQFTLTDWLIYQTGSLTDLLMIAGQTVIYCGFLLAATLFDVMRKNV